MDAYEAEMRRVGLEHRDIGGPKMQALNQGQEAAIAETVRPYLLIERQKTHGDFRDNGQIMQALKDVIRYTGKNWGQLRPYQREALDMIVHKVGRIMSGDPNVVDHWDDIAGYATCVACILREDGLAK